MPFKIVPLWAAWKEYVQACEARKFGVPSMPEAGFAAMTDEGHFAAGVCLYPSQKLCVAEFLVTNPDIPMWERHKAVVEMAKAFVTYAAVSCKTPWVMVRSDGLARILVKVGYFTNGARCFVGPT